VNYGKLLLKWHRWAHLLKQQSAITVHRLPTKENKQQTNGSVQFPLSVCFKQTEVAIVHWFRFLIALHTKLAS
jgi:hypothetical protein